MAEFNFDLNGDNFQDNLFDDLLDDLAFESEMGNDNNFLGEYQFSPILTSCQKLFTACVFLFCVSYRL